MTSVGTVGGESHVFTYSTVFKQKIYCLFLRMGLREDGGIVEVMIVWSLKMKHF